MPGAGVLRSNLAVATAAAQARAGGAEIMTGHVHRVSVRGRSVLVSVDGREREFDHVVLACGAWTPRLVPELGRVVEPRVVPSVWLPGTPADRFAPPAFPPGFRRRADGTGFTFLPAVGDDPAKFVVWNPRRDVARDPADLRCTAGTAELAEATTAVVTATLDGIGGSPHRVARYADGFTPDRWPVVETLDERLTVLAGFSGGGFAIAPAMAGIAADAATGARPDSVVDTMRLSRFTDPAVDTDGEAADALVR